MYYLTVYKGRKKDTQLCILFYKSIITSRNILQVTYTYNYYDDICGSPLWATKRRTMNAESTVACL